ncbi:RDD family protein, partial [Verrucomicrobia bacterium]|nr:RDD family protein [Verrucomicrobiota bacterium]
GGNVTVKQLDLIEQYLNRCTTFPFERRRDLTEKMAAPLWKLSGNIRPQADSMASTLERDETFLDSLLQLANEEKTLSSDALPMTDHTTFF